LPFNTLKAGKSQEVFCNILSGIGLRFGVEDSFCLDSALEL